MTAMLACLLACCQSGTASGTVVLFHPSSSFTGKSVCSGQPKELFGVCVYNLPWQKVVLLSRFDPFLLKKMLLLPKSGIEQYLFQLKKQNASR